MTRPGSGMPCRLCCITGERMRVLLRLGIAYNAHPYFAGLLGAAHMLKNHVERTHPVHH